MIKRFFVGLLKTIVVLTLCAAVVIVAVKYIYDEYSLNPQVLEDEYQEIVSTTLAPTPTPEPTPEPTPAPTPAPDWPALDVTSWEFRLVNTENTLENYKPAATKYFDGCLMDSRIVEAAKALTVDARAADKSIYLTSGYIPYSTSKDNTDEHQTGLAIDFMQSSKAAKDVEAYEKTSICTWLERHAYEYGFILRYPEGKEDITGVDYEPWHYRYVGVEAATYMNSKGLCLEEFLALYETE